MNNKLLEQSRTLSTEEICVKEENVPLHHRSGGGPALPAVPVLIYAFAHDWIVTPVFTRG